MFDQFLSWLLPFDWENFDWELDLCSIIYLFFFHTDFFAETSSHLFPEIFLENELLDVLGCKVMYLNFIIGSGPVLVIAKVFLLEGICVGEDPNHGPALVLVIEQDSNRGTVLALSLVNESYKLFILFKFEFFLWQLLVSQVNHHKFFILLFFSLAILAFTVGKIT